MWGHEKKGGGTLMDSAVLISLLKSALIPDKRWKWLATHCSEHAQQTNALTQPMKQLDCFISSTDPIRNDWAKSPFRSNCRDDRMMAVIIMISQPLLLCLCESRRPTLCGLCAPVCAKHRSNPPNPLPPPHPVADFGNVTEHQSFVRGQWGLRFERDASLWEQLSNIL